MLWLPGTHLGRCAGNGSAIRHRRTVHHRKRKLYFHGTGHEPPPFLEIDLLPLETCSLFLLHANVFRHTVTCTPPFPFYPHSPSQMFFQCVNGCEEKKKGHRWHLRSSLTLDFRCFLFQVLKWFWQTVDFLSPHLRWCSRVCERSVQSSSSWVLRIVLMFIFRTPETLTVVYAYRFTDPKCSETDSLSFLTVSSRWGVSCDEVAKVAMVQLVGYRGSSSASPPGLDVLFSGCYSVYFTSFMCWQRWWCSRAARQFLLCHCTQECRDNPGMLENSCMMPKLQGSHLSTT